ncbi:MAG: hypothetical protein EA397_17320 [Deltaproteobacteria bacterium]|nr:MAG: hypothetical protein EA397_17320 [Deltaproteobacteria bacterium]
MERLPKDGCRRLADPSEQGPQILRAAGHAGLRGRKLQERGLYWMAPDPAAAPRLTAGQKGTMR